MTAYRDEAPDESGAPVPRDLPDQQAGAADDPWEVVPGRDGDADGRAEEDGSADTGLPDPDESGAGRPGAPRSGQVRPGAPVPDEASD